MYRTGSMYYKYAILEYTKTTDVWVITIATFSYPVAES